MPLEWTKIQKILAERYNLELETYLDRPLRSAYPSDSNKSVDTKLYEINKGNVRDTYLIPIQAGTFHTGISSSLAKFTNELNSLLTFSNLELIYVRNTVNPGDPIEERHGIYLELLDWVSRDNTQLETLQHNKRVALYTGLVPDAGLDRKLVAVDLGRVPSPLLRDDITVKELFDMIKEGYKMIERRYSHPQK